MGTESTTDDTGGLANSAYSVIGQDLADLKKHFNANEGRVRLMFLSGPTCGICLRGMADLNDAFVAERQNDERLVTYVVHVPTMGAKEKHVADTIPLLSGPKVHHYWEDSGILGQHYSEIMDVDMYVWDFRAIYGPDAAWDGLLPPVPEYFEHQLGVTSGTFRGFPGERVLDAERFAMKTLAWLETVDAGRFVEPADLRQRNADALGDGTSIAYVGQPRNVAVRQHILGRGGYKNLKRIQSIRMTGKLAMDDRNYRLLVTSDRPDSLQRRADDDVRLPEKYESLLIDTFEFDGLFVDSHTGGLIRKIALDENGDVLLRIDQGDFRETDGFRFAHRLTYTAADGTVIATETIDSIDLEVAPFDLVDGEVTH